MGTVMQVVSLAVMLVSPAVPERAAPLRYWGAAPDDSGAGRLTYQGRHFQVKVGDEIPGWGRIHAVTPQALVVRHTLTASEKDARATAGALVVDVQDLHIPRTGPNLACAGECPETTP
jgi:hypothetical protein